MRNATFAIFHFLCAVHHLKNVEEEAKTHYSTIFSLEVMTEFLIVMFQFDFARHDDHNLSIIHLCTNREIEHQQKARKK